jgi:hypothetical protein
MKYTAFASVLALLVFVAPVASAASCIGAFACNSGPFNTTTYGAAQRYVPQSAHQYSQSYYPRHTYQQYYYPQYQHSYYSYPQYSYYQPYQQSYSYQYQNQWQSSWYSYGNSYDYHYDNDYAYYY